MANFDKKRKSVMASGLLILLDDISLLLDDVAAMTKLAAKKTAGVLGDDLALNAKQVTGVQAVRELPVVWAVAKGSLLNKVILVPAALLIDGFLPMAMMPLLMVGGLFLCFEGAEKIAHSYFSACLPQDHTAAEDISHAVNTTMQDLAVLEREKITGAIRTDFILSAEIVVISLGTMVQADWLTKTTSLALIALLMTVGVYGLVALIVKMDDVGLHLLRQSSPLGQKIGRLILAFAPVLMRGLSVAGTLAMFLVGGGIVVHGLPMLHHGIEYLAHQAGTFAGVVSALFAGVLGLLAGFMVLAAVLLAVKLKKFCQ